MITEEYRLNIEKITAQHAIPTENLKFDVDSDRLIGFTVLQLVRKVCYLPPKADRIYVPKTWKDHFKQRWFPKWLRDHFPIEYHCYEARAYFPNLAIPSHGNYAHFFTFQNVREPSFDLPDRDS